MGWKAQVNGVQVMLTWNGMAAPIVFAPNLEAATALADAINRTMAGESDDSAGAGAIAVVSKMVDNAERARADHIYDLRKTLDDRLERFLAGAKEARDAP
jgi:hypothetical protein